MANAPWEQVVSKKYLGGLFDNDIGAWCTLFDVHLKFLYFQIFNSYNNLVLCMSSLTQIRLGCKTKY